MPPSPFIPDASHPIIIRYAEAGSATDKAAIQDCFISAHRTLIFSGVTLTIRGMCQQKPYIVAAPAAFFCLPYLFSCYSSFAWLLLSFLVYVSVFLALWFYSHHEWTTQLQRATTTMDVSRVVFRKFNPHRVASAPSQSQSDGDGDCGRDGDGEQEGIGVFVVLEDVKTKKVVGCAAILQGAAFNRYRDPLLNAIDETDSTLGMIARVAIAPHCHGRGLGKLMLSSVLLEAKRRGIRRLQLATSSVQIAACRLYESFGFKRIKSQKLMPIFPVEKYVYQLDILAEIDNE